MKAKRSSKFILNLLGIGTALSLLGDATLYTVLPQPAIVEQLGITLAMVGLLLGANRAVRLLLNGPVGMLYDRMPRRGLLITALTLGACSSIFYALGHGVWLLLMGRILWGLAWALLWVGGNSVVLDVSTEENRGRNSGIYQMWFFFGIATTSLFGALLTDLLGFRRGQWISVGVIATTALMWFLFLPETRRADDIENNSHQKRANLTRVSLPIKVMTVSSVTLFVSRFLSWGVLAATTTLWLSELFGNGVQIWSNFVPIATVSGLFTAVSNLISIGSTPFVGSISDKLKRRWPVIGWAIILGGLGLWLMSGEIRTLALIGACLIPIASSTTETLIPAVTGDQVPEKLRSRALGVINTAGDLGATIGPFAALGAINAGWLSLGEIYKISAIGFGLVAILVLSAFANRKATKAPKKDRRF